MLTSTVNKCGQITIRNADTLTYRSRRESVEAIAGPMCFFYSSHDAARTAELDERERMINAMSSSPDTAA
jgi:hypothetical protein